MNKKLTLPAVALMLLSAMFALQSCSEEDSPVPSTDYLTGLVTVRPTTDGGDALTLQLTDAIALQPTNLSKSPFGEKEVRAVINFNVLDDSDAKKWFVHVNYLDSIRTKPMIAAAEAGKDYGNDPIEIVKNWATCVEDGYLTLRVRTRWGGSGTVHYLNLVQTSCKDNVCEMELHHNAGGDLNGYYGDALIAFSLKDMPKLEGTNAKIRLSWMSFTGKKTAEFFVNEGGTLFDPEGEFPEATSEAPQTHSVD